MARLSKPQVASKFELQIRVQEVGYLQGTDQVRRWQLSHLVESGSVISIHGLSTLWRDERLSTRSLAVSLDVI